MIEVERSITIYAPLEEVFAYVEDPRNNPEWLPGMIQVSDIAGQGAGLTYRWRYKMAGFPFDGESTVAEWAPNERIVVNSKGGGSVSTWVWTFEPYPGGTKINLRVEYTIPAALLGRLAEVLVRGQNEREADLAMTNIKARLES